MPTRRRERAKHLILLPTVEVVEADIFAPGVLERLAAGTEAVINLVGILHGRRGRPDERGPNDYGPDFARVHVELPQALARRLPRRRRAPRAAHQRHRRRAARAFRIPALKAIGEQAVLAAEDLDVTAFRPSIVFGPEDKFLNQFATMLKLLPGLAVPCPRAQFQPVYVGDVARAMVAALDDRETRGKAYELCGPSVYTMKRAWWSTSAR